MHDFVKGRTFKTIHDFCTSVASEVKKNKNYMEVATIAFCFAALSAPLHAPFQACTIFRVVKLSFCFFSPSRKFPPSKGGGSMKSLQLHRK